MKSKGIMKAGPVLLTALTAGLLSVAESAALQQVFPGPQYSYPALLNRETSVQYSASGYANEEEHFAYLSKDLGPSDELTGDVEIILVFVSTPEHPWTQEKKDEVNRVSSSSIEYMEQEADRYGADLSLMFGGLDFSIPFEYDSDLEWYYWILEHYWKEESIADVCKYYENSLGKDSTPVIFLFNSWDRSYTYACHEKYPGWNEEFCVIFCDTDMHDNYLTHELLHQYGAIDLYDYRNEGVQAATEKYLPDSDMYTVSHTIDDLTAYLVGWTDTLTYDAWMFINETEGLR